VSLPKPYYKNSHVTIYHGDCMDILPELNKVDMVLTDPPYGTTTCDWDCVIPFGPLWEQLNKLIKENGAIVLFGSEPFSSALRMSNIKNYKYDIIWEKDKAANMLNSNRQILKIHENISIFYKNQCVFNPQKVKLAKPYRHKNRNVDSDMFGSNSKSYNKNGYTTYTHSFPKSIQRFSKDNAGKGIHPTQKPIKLMEYLIKTYTNEKETVLDFTAGSGTTAVACIQLNRKCIGIEIEEKYCEIAAKRCEDVPSNLFFKIEKSRKKEGKTLL